jgi:hypothetical protein
MALFASEWDIHGWQQAFNAATGYPNLGRLADNLDALREWTNDNSDGWAYWVKPRRAAQRIIATLHTTASDLRDYRSGDVVDLTEADVKRLLAPVKAFLTRQGVAHTDVLL